MIKRRSFHSLLAGVALAPWLATASMAQAQYDTGASDTEIRIGNTMPYSGPASSYGVNGRMIAAVMAHANANGGVNGRQINFITYDDAYNPARTLEQVRRLVEQDEVLFLAGTVGSAHNIAIQRYVNQREIPHLLVLAGGERWNDPENYPWTVSGLLTPYGLEGYAFGQHVLETNPDARIAVLFQNDDMGREYLGGLERALEGSNATIVRSDSYEVADPSVDAQIVSLHATGADTLMMFAGPRAVAQSIRKAADLGWDVARYMGNVSSVISTSLEPAGLDISTGIITALTQVEPSDPEFQQTPEYAAYMETLQGFYPEGDPNNGSVINGYNTGQAILQLLEAAGDNLTRENLLALATNMEFQLPMMLEGINFRTEPDNYQLVRGVRLARFNGTTYDLFGDVVEY